MKQRFLEENHRGIYSHMLLSEILWKHLAEVDEECNEMMDRLVERMAKSEGVTEQLKSDDFTQETLQRLCLYHKEKIVTDTDLSLLLGRIDNDCFAVLCECKPTI